MLSKGLLHGMGRSVVGETSIVVTDRPSAWTASIVHDFTDSPSTSTVHAPHDDVSQPTLVPVSPHSSRRNCTSSSRGSTSCVWGSPVDGHRDLHTDSSRSRCRVVGSLPSVARPPYSSSDTCHTRSLRIEIYVRDGCPSDLTRARWRVLDLLAERERIDAELPARRVVSGDALREADGSASPVAGFAHRGSLLRREAASLIRSARLVRGHERIRTALARGTVRTTHVQELGRVARHREELFADHVDTLIDAAESVDPSGARRSLVDGRPTPTTIRTTTACPQRHTTSRWLDVAVTFAGSVRVDGLDPEGGATFLAALGQHEEPPNAGDTRSAGTRRADALIQLAQGTERSSNP